MQCPSMHGKYAAEDLKQFLVPAHFDETPYH